MDVTAEWRDWKGVHIMNQSSFMRAQGYRVLSTVWLVSISCDDRIVNSRWPSLLHKTEKKKKKNDITLFADSGSLTKISQPRPTTPKRRQHYPAPRSPTKTPAPAFSPVCSYPRSAMHGRRRSAYEAPGGNAG